MATAKNTTKGHVLALKSQQKEEKTRQGKLRYGGLEVEVELRGLNGHLQCEKPTEIQYTQRMEEAGYPLTASLDQSYDATSETM
jgi:hypothetical protein